MRAADKLFRRACRHHQRHRFRRRAVRSPASRRCPHLRRYLRAHAARRRRLGLRTARRRQRDCADDRARRREPVPASRSRGAPARHRRGRLQCRRRAPAGRAFVRSRRGSGAVQAPARALEGRAFRSHAGSEAQMAPHRAGRRNGAARERLGSARRNRPRGDRGAATRHDAPRKLAGTAAARPFDRGRA